MEEPKINLLGRALLYISAAVTSLFVAEDAANFSTVQIAIAFILVATLVLVAAFWETLAELFRTKKTQTSLVGQVSGPTVFAHDPFYHASDPRLREGPREPGSPFFRTSRARNVHEVDKWKYYRRC